MVPDRTRAASEAGQWSRLFASALGPEARVVAEVKEEVASKCAVLLDGRPAATGGVVTLVEALPRELHTGVSVTGRVAPVDPTLDRNEPETAHVIRFELDEPRSDEVDILLGPAGPSL